MMGKGLLGDGQGKGRSISRGSTWAGMRKTLWVESETCPGLQCLRARKDGYRRKRVKGRMRWHRGSQGNLKTDWGVTDTRNPCTACKGRRIIEFKASLGKTLPFPKREDRTKGKQGWQKTTGRVSQVSPTITL